MKARMRWKRSAGIATSASWKVILQAWRTTRAPILMSRVCSLVSDQEVHGRYRSNKQTCVK